jgi:tetratricopeptide (TPR) repeat protein
VLASLLVVAGIATVVQPCFAQGASAPAAGQVQMSADEYKVYNDAAQATTPAAQAAGWEAYLKAYPNSAVKKDVLERLTLAYSQANDSAKAQDAADRLLQVDPKNFQGQFYETYLRKTAADALTDPAAKSAALDQAAGYAQKGLALGKPSGMDDAHFATATTTFESTIADDDISKKDYANAIPALKAEFASAPANATQTPGPVLQDVFYLALSYMNSTPPDYLNCAWYGTRAAAFAAQFAPSIQPTATYCYKKYHGNTDDYDKLQALVKTSLTPPADLGTTIKAAPKPADIVANLIATTPDLATLAPGDKEYVFQNGNIPDPKTGTIDPATGKVDPKTQKTYADEVFDTVKGKSREFGDALVISATADAVQVAFSDDAVQSKTADFTFNMKEPLKTVPKVGDKVKLEGTYASYTSSPVMVIMSDGVLVAPKKAPARPPVRHRASH